MLAERQGYFTVRTTLFSACRIASASVSVAPTVEGAISESVRRNPRPIATAIFPKGTRGSQLDSFARRPLWEAGLDYAHGTGHGVGSFLAVHEGPQRISPVGSSQPGGDEPLRAGMILSNEPGYYKSGEYGIRIENLVLVVDIDVEGAEKPVLGFETLTWAPIDRALIDVSLLTPEERAWVDRYHARVLDIVGSQLEADVLEWLKAQCAPL